MKGALEKHIAYHHDSQYKTKKCNYCELHFYEKEMVLNHMHKMHSKLLEKDGVQLIFCPICQVKFISNRNLKLHL